jgi:redox-sensitive bicupin YhaK (pirin superfamily)
MSKTHRSNGIIPGAAISRFEVGRVLPWAKRRMVGPFVFFDHMGPVELAANLPRRVDAAASAHGLATITICSRARSSIATVSVFIR